MGLVARKSITLNVEAVPTSYEVEIKFLPGQGCLLVAESPSLWAHELRASGEQPSSWRKPGPVQIQISQAAQLSLFLVLQIKCLFKAELLFSERRVYFLGRE